LSVTLPDVTIISFDFGRILQWFLNGFLRSQWFFFLKIKNQEDFLFLFFLFI